VSTRDAIVDAACSCLKTSGARDITVAMVARAAKVSSALVHYHFATKRQLLAAAAVQLARRRAERRGAALQSARGLAGLDALWSALAEGGERVAPDLILLGREDRETRTLLQVERRRELTLVAGAVGRMLTSLGAAPPLTAEDLGATVCTFLDGAAAALAGGTAAADVRASYDAFWLALVALGQTGPSR